MGLVYLARDTRLARDVAIKVLPEKLADNPEALARFEREAKAIAALSHPNVLSIFDVGNEEGVSFVVTELLEGETLRQHIRGSAVPWRKAIDYGAAIADGLAAAHAKGVIHRDLKPENIFLTSDGGIKILDFGLARIETGVGGDAGSGDMVTKTLDTKPGTVLGTLNYMSPEQVRGKKTDARSDIFALGCVLHEMVGGQKTFSGETSADTMTAILKDEPVSVLDSCSDAGPELDRVISRCLEKKPEQRFHSATDLAFTLRGILSSTSVFKPPPEAERRQIPTLVKLLGALALSAGLIFAGWYVPQRLNKPATAPPVDVGEIRSLAVLPVDNISGDPAEEFFADSMTDALITDVSKISALKVISRPSVMPYKNTNKSLKSIARELNVDALLSSSVVRVADKVRITAQLIDGLTEDILWSDRFDGDMTDILALQADVARSIAAEVKVTLTPAEETLLADAPPVNAKAHEAYMRGLHSLQKTTKAGGLKAIEFFKQAIAEDPDFARAYAGLANAYMALTSYHLAPKETMPFAKDAATKALLLDEDSAEAHFVLGRVKLVYDWDWPGAEAEFKKALELNPNSAAVHVGYAEYLAAMLRPDESIAHLEKAEALDPVSIVQDDIYGLALFMSRRYDRTIEFCRRVIHTDADFFAGHLWLGLALSMDGRYPEAIEELKEARRLSDAPLVAASLGDIYARSGDAQSAREIIDYLVEEAKTRYVCPYEVGVIYVGLSEEDAAFERLDQACEDRSDCIPWLQADPRLDPIRSDPRFDAVLRRAGFTPPQRDHDGAAAPQPVKKVLVVLPFDNRSGNPDARYLADEIPASIIDSLSMLSQLQVVPRSTAFRHRDRIDDVAAVGKLLGAYAVLTGQINTRGDELRIRAELIEVATNRQLWSQRYDQSLADTLAVETEITERIATALQVQFGVTELARLMQRCPANTKAHCKYLEGRYWWNKRSLASVRKSIELFDEALSLDPQYALAHVGMADSYCVLGWAYDRPSDTFPKARAAAEKALAIDPDFAEAYPAIGFVRLVYDWDAAGAKKAFDSAIALDPVYAKAHHWYTMYLLLTGRPDEGLASARQARKLDPGSLMINWSVGTALLVGRDYAAAAKQLQHTLEMEPNFLPAQQMLGTVYQRMERYDEAIEIYRRLHDHDGRTAINAGKLGLLYALAGRRAEALEELRILEELAEERYIPPLAFAEIHAGLGDKDEAFTWLDRAIKERDCHVVFLRSSPTFDELRADPRFQDLLRRIGSEP